MKTLSIYVIAFVIAVICSVTLLAGAEAEAVEIPEIRVLDEYTIAAVAPGLLKISFEHNGDILSLYWEGELQKQTIWVEIWSDIEVIDAGYVK